MQVSQLIYLTSIQFVDNEKLYSLSLNCRKVEKKHCGQNAALCDFDIVDDWVPKIVAQILYLRLLV